MKFFKLNKDKQTRTLVKDQAWIRSSSRLELETLVAEMSDAVVAFDREENLLFWNAPFAFMAGIRADFEGNLRLLSVVRDPEILSAIRSCLKEDRRFRQKQIAMEVEGRRRYFSLSVAPLRSELETYGGLGIFHDITELKLAEQMRIDFVANVSHEVRTPLTAIKGFTETLIQDLKEGKPADLSFLEIIARNTERLVALVQDLLELSTLDSGNGALQKENLGTEALTERVLAQLSMEFSKKNQKVESNYFITNVYADAKRIEQILVNLLDNARKYSPNGATIRITWESKESDAVLLRVQDDGPGIPKEHHDRLFERFYRADLSRAREQGGTGLGLAIVKHIMQQHGGAVWVNSESGKGSIFSCQFPNSADRSR